MFTFLSNSKKYSDVKSRHTLLHDMYSIGFFTFSQNKLKTKKRGLNQCIRVVPDDTKRSLMSLLIIPHTQLSV